MLDRLKEIQHLLTSLENEPYYNKHMALLGNDNNFKKIQSILVSMVEEMSETTIKKLTFPSL